jgi:arylsulfatase A-like enzyme/Flp pilus assembly protein TadD
MVDDPRRGSRRGVLLLILGLLAPAGCGTMRETRGIVLVTLDTTRADRLGCYGYAAAATPHLDALARDGVRFEHATSAVPTTLASHATMFTGEYPPQHGVRYNGMFRLGEASVTVAEILRDRGWATAAVPAAYPVAKTTGIGQGFETYMDLFAEPGAEKLPQDAERRAEDVTRLGIEWLRQVQGKRFFLWLHYYDPHYPYEPPFPYSSTFRSHPYDGEIAYVDREIGKVLSALGEEVLVVVAGDHGEGLYDHEEKMHANLVYESTLHVPLIVKAPGGRRGKVVREPVTLADVAPTLLDYAQAPIPAEVEGISLEPAVLGKAPPRRALYFESLTGSLVYGWSPLEGIRRASWKLIRSASSSELYDLDADPEEKIDVNGREAAIAEDLGTELSRRLEGWGKRGSKAETTDVPMDTEAQIRLAQLGYIGGTVSPERRGGAHPRDKVHLEASIFEAHEAIGASSFEEGLRAAQSVLAEDPANRYALHMATIASGRLGRFEEAERLAHDLVRRYPEYLPGAVALGELQVRRGAFEEAAGTFRAGLIHHAGEPALTYRLALALLAQGKVPEASQIVEAAIAEKEEAPSFLVVRAVCRAKLGDPDGARRALAQAIEEGYRDRTVLESEPLLAPLRRVPGVLDLVGKLPKEASSKG